MMQIIGVAGIREISRGDDLPAIIWDALSVAGITLQDGDVLVVTHKIVSKAEGAIVEVDPDDPDAHRLVAQREAAAVLRRRGDLIITETKHGFVCANAGVDRSNMPAGQVALLPHQPDKSAHTIRRRMEAMSDVRLGVIITDTFGRAWRRGLTDVAIGLSGFPAIVDHRGRPDAQGRIMEVTEVAVADEVAAAADLVMGKADNVPVAVVRGLDIVGPDGRASDLVRPPSEDLFR
jgi:coenzyme F420-0:L-glutamate ligase/coenzyme F420-1:gamma-L-glutamate ligase